MMRATPSRPHRDPSMALPLAVVALVLNAITALFGIWWIPLLSGFVLGLTPVRGRHAVLYALAAGFLGWAVALLWLALHEPLGTTASAVAGILGVGSGIAMILITLIFAALLGLVGAWLGIALRGLFAPKRRPYDFR